MRARNTFLLLAPVVLLLLVVGGTMAFDASRGDTIPKGVKVGGVDVGGLSATEAKAKLNREFMASVKKPITVHWDTSSWILGAREAKIAANVDAMVDRALAFKDEGNAFSRSLRRITGGELDKSLTPSVSFSDRAIIRMLDKIRSGVNRKPQDASISFENGAFKKVESRTGLQVDASALHRQIKAAIVSPTAARTFTAQTAKQQPKVTDKNLAKEFGTVLVVDRSAFTLKLYKNLKLEKTYSVAVGAQGLETPAGLYHIQNKAENPAWTVPNSAWAGSLAGQVIPGGAANNPLKARWLGIFDGAGIHGTSDDASIGSAASHGCVRMHVSDVIDLYPRVPVGAPIYIS